MDKKKQPISTTRTFETTQGEVTYAELSDMIAPHLLKLLDEITDKKFIERDLNEDLIQEFHNRIVGDVMPQIAGHWRKVPVQVGNWLPPEPYEVPLRMAEYVRNLRARKDYADTIDLQVEALAYAEGEFLSIHPFQDFNGRTIRAILIELEMRFDLPGVDPAVERDTPLFKRYQDALAEYDNGRIDSLVKFWEERLGR